MTKSNSDSWRRRAKVLARKNPDAIKSDPENPAPLPKTDEVVDSPGSEAKAVDSDSDGWQELDALAAFEASKPEKGDVALHRNKRVSWVEWSGFLAVAALLIAAWVVRYQRPAPMPRVADGKPQRDDQPPVESSQASGPIASSAKPVARKNAGQIAKSVLDDAGDGSFALENAAEFVAVLEAPTPKPTPTARPVTPDAETSAVATKPKSFARAPDPLSIVPVVRAAVAIDAEEPLRKQLQLTPRTRAFISFDRIYPVAFESHQSYLAMKAKDSNSEETELELDKCIGLFSQCLDRPAREFTGEQRNQITYTLAKLYFDAGRLYESAVYALSVARTADPAKPIAKAGVSLAFAALQEAYLAHYGDPLIPGELEQMNGLCDLVSRRGLKHPQLHAMRFATAQRFDQAGLHVKAAQAFTRIPKSSPLFAKAQLAAGRAFWSEAVIREKEGIKKQLDAIVSSSAKYLHVAIDLADGQDSITPTLLAGQFALSEIALRRDDPALAIQLLDGPNGVLQRTAVVSAGKSEAFKDLITAAYEQLFQAHSKVGDLEGIQDALDQLSKRYGRAGKTRIANLQTQVAREFLENLDANRSITAEQVVQLEQVMDSVLDPKRKPSPDIMLWAADSWANLASRCQQADVRKRCFEQADRLLQKVAETDEFNAAEKLTLQIKRADLAAEIGEVDQAVRLLSELLRQTPTAVDVQIKVARLMTDQAKDSSDPDAFALAIAGRPDDAIWGWAKLTNNLAHMHLDSDDQSRYLDRLLLSGYHLNESRILQSQRMPLGDQRSQLLEVARKHIRQLVTTFAQSSGEWTEKLEALQP